MVEWFDDRLPGEPEPAAQIIPERDAQFVTRLEETEESIAAVPADVAPRPGADLNPSLARFLSLSATNTENP